MDNDPFSVHSTVEPSVPLHVPDPMSSELKTNVEPSAPKKQGGNTLPTLNSLQFYEYGF